MNEDQLDILRPLVEAETGMDFGGGRSRRLAEAAEKVAARNGLAGSLDRMVRSPQQYGAFLEELTAELTVGESFFFRNEHHFEALREHVFPRILRENASRREIRTWSAGCATGEEPYSLAILLHQLIGPRKPAWTLSVLGTDINTEFLRRGHLAEYRDWSFRRTNIQEDERYFVRARGKICLLPDVRECVRLAYLNLVKDVYPSPLTGTMGLDLILFRNVAIYLRPNVVEAIVDRFFQCLRPGGWLLLGEAEVAQMRPVGFEIKRIGQATFFHKPDLSGSTETLSETPGPVLQPRYVPEQPLAATPRAAHGLVPVDRAERPAAIRPVPVVKHSTPPAAAPRADQPPLDWEDVEQYLLSEEFAAAESLLSAVLDRSHRADLRLKFVRRLLELSQTARAHDALDAFLVEDPLVIESHLLKASLLEESGDLAEAENACRRGLYVDRKCAMAHFQLALVQQRQGDATAARKSLEFVEKLAKSRDPNDLVEHGDGVCYGRLREMAQLMAAY